MPWESQCANSCPENFELDELDRSVIVCQEPGLYEVKMAFFGLNRSTIDFRVNNETIMTAVNSQNNVVHHTQNKWQGRASFQALTGLSVIEYVALPAQAKISIGYNHSSQS